MSIFAEQERPIRRYVALKVIKIGMDTREVIARFEAERQALALMDHPCIAQVYEAGAHSDGRPYFVMEYVAGIPITQYCDRHRLSTRARLELFIQVCGAIQHAHQKGVIHRDIKPSNLLVTVQDGKAIPKVIDFGVAKATHQRLTEKTVFTQHGVLIGTPAYMSPEQAEMSGLDVDTRTDIYALGVLLYELLVGALPFDPEMLRQAGYAEIQRIIREQEPLRPSARLSSLHGAAVSIAKQRHTEPATLERELKGDLDWITLKAMEKDRTRRYPSASELAADVTRYLGNDPVTARPVSLRYRLGKFARKHRAAVLGGTLAVSTLAVAFAVSVGLYVRSETARRHAEWQAYLAAIAAADAQVVAAESGAARFAAVHEAERRLISAPYRWRSWEWNYLVTKLDESVATLWGTTDPSTVFRRPVYGGKLAVSPDDTHLFWSTTQGLHEWDLRTYSLVSAWPAHGTVFALSDDGSRLLSTEWRLPDVPPARGPWRVIVTKTGAVLSILETNMSDVRLAEFSPDGEQIIMVGGDRSVGVWATGSGEHLGLTHISEPVVGVGFVTSHRLWILVTETAIHTWSLVSGDRSHAMVVPAGVTLTKGAVSPRGEGVLTVDNLGTLRLWRLDSRQDRLVGRHERTTSLALANDGQRAASADAFGVVRLWDLQSQGPSQVLNAHDHPQVDALLFSNSDQYVIAASQGKLRVWDPKRVSATYDWSVPPQG